jgi:hypothetical protein
MNFNNIYEGASKAFSYTNLFSGPLRPHFIRPVLKPEVNNNIIKALSDSFKEGRDLDSTIHIGGAFLNFTKLKNKPFSLDSNGSFLNNVYLSERVHHSVSFLPPQFSNFGLGFIKDNPTV